jgi:hypothetical protein
MDKAVQQLCRGTVKSPFRQIIEVLQQMMRTHDAEKLPISVLQIYEDS